MPPGKEAAAVEAALGVPVLQHAGKKPGGSAESLTQHFGWVCQQCFAIHSPLHRNLKDGQTTVFTLADLDWTVHVNLRLEHGVDIRINLIPTLD